MKAPRTVRRTVPTQTVVGNFICSYSFVLLCGSLFLAGCSKQEKQVDLDAEWEDIQALTDDAVMTVPEKKPEADMPEIAVEKPAVPLTDFDFFLDRLTDMKLVRRKTGQTLLTGEHLVFDYDSRFVRMTNHVVVTDDRGGLTADKLTGRFTVSNELHFVEAEGAVKLRNEDRIAAADAAVYNHRDGVVLLDGNASASDSTNSISGDRLQLWLSEENEVEAAEASGGVKIRNGERTAFGESVKYDGIKGFAKLEGGASVTDGTHSISGDILQVWLTPENELKKAEAIGAVKIESGERRAEGGTALYDAEQEFVQLQGQALVSDGTNTISGERIQAWITAGSRKVICEPNVVLQISESRGLALDGVSAKSGGNTEIRGNRLVFEENKRLAELDGNVRVRDPRAAMNCGTVRVYLKDSQEIDWIEALNEVIIHADDTKALADRATYQADEGKFTLEGDPKVKQEQHIMTADRIIIWQETHRILCEPNARALLFLDDETKAKFLKDLNN